MSSKGKKLILKVVVLGDSSVGKTSLTRRYFDNKFTIGYVATVGADLVTKKIKIENKDVTVQVFSDSKQLNLLF
jgi:Ras-related protein Rab-7A